MVLEALNDRVAVITGASRGIGAGLAEEFAARGMRLGLCSRSRPAIADGPDVLAEELDVAEPGALAAFARRVSDRLGAIDLWINNAGILEPIAPVREIDPADFDRNLRVNLMGVLLGTQAYLDHLRDRGPAAEDDRQRVLINISSGAAWQGYAGWAAYCASKAGVDRLTEVVHLEERAAGLRAYAVAPGVVDTHMQELIRGSAPEDFPEVERFRELQRSGGFNSISFVASHLLELAFGSAMAPEGPLVRLPQESPSAAAERD